MKTPTFKDLAKKSEGETPTPQQIGSFQERIHEARASLRQRSFDPLKFLKSKIQESENH